MSDRKPEIAYCWQVSGPPVYPWYQTARPVTATWNLMIVDLLYAIATRLLLLLRSLVRIFYRTRALQKRNLVLSLVCRLSHAPYPCPGVVYIMCIGSPLYPGRKVYRDILNSILLTTSSCPISKCVSLFCRKLLSKAQSLSLCKALRAS